MDGHRPWKADATVCHNGGHTDAHAVDAGLAGQRGRSRLRSESRQTWNLSAGSHRLGPRNLRPAALGLQLLASAVSELLDDDVQPTQLRHSDLQHNAELHGTDLLLPDVGGLLVTDLFDPGNDLFAANG